MGRRRYYAYNDDPFDGCFGCLSIFAALFLGLGTFLLIGIAPGWLLWVILFSFVIILSTRAYIENKKITRDSESKPNNNIPQLLDQKEGELKTENKYYKLRNSETTKIEALFDKLEGIRIKLDSSDSYSLNKVDQRIDECLRLWRLHWEKQKVSPPPALKSYLDREVDLIKERGFDHIRFDHVKDFNAGDTWHIGPRGGRYRYVNGRKRYDG